MRFKSYFLRNTYWLKDYLEGSPIRSHYNDIRNIMENPIIGYRLRKKYLDNLLSYSKQYSKFYNQCTNTKLEDFPVVNKTFLLENYDEIKIPVNRIPNQTGYPSIQVTSGSTGTPFAIPQNTDKRNRRLAELKYFGEKSGFKSHERLVHLRAWNKWQGKSKLQSFRENIIPFDIAKMNKERLRELCAIINNYKVFAVRGYASSIDLFVRYVVEREIKLPSLIIMVAGSESLQESTRFLVDKYIGCKIISQYANEENGILAQEKSFNNLKHSFCLNHASYIFEILKLEDNKPAAFGELGRIIVTDLFNYAFPLIRYDTGDTGIMVNNTKGYPILDKLYGRRVDLVYD